MSDRPVPSSKAVSARLSRQATQATAPELALRRALHGKGYRYRIQYPVPGWPRRRIDIAFPSQRVAVDVRGCFWHQCPEHGNRPAANRGWWREKLERNVERDGETVAALQAAGWTVVVVWEHESLSAALERVEGALAG